MAETFVYDPAALQRLFESSDGPVFKDIERRAIRVESTAKHLCPVKTGRLRSSITHQTGVDDRGPVARIGTNVDYAIHVFLGTSRMAARPALQAALGSAK